MITDWRLRALGRGYQQANKHTEVWIGKIQTEETRLLGEYKSCQIQVSKKIHRFLIVSSVLEIFVKRKMYLGRVTNLEFIS